MKTRITLAVCTFALCLHAMAADDLHEPYQKRATQGARAMQLTPLPNDADGVASRSREARIWIGFGGADPQDMVRVVWRLDGTIEATHYAFYRSNFRTAPDAEGSFKEFAKKCQALGNADGVEACRGTGASPVPIADFAKKLGELGLWDLPDESRVPRNPDDMTITDGAAMLVELRDNNGYRYYAWTNSWVRTDPQAYMASRLQRYVTWFARKDD